MGEAKRKKEKLKALLLEEIERWSAAPSLAESALVEELEQKATFLVNRAPKAQLEWARMPPRLCHDNARWYAENDPEHLSKQVIGWRVSPGGIFTLHSVVEREGELVCVTPAAIEGEPDYFDFIPDQDISVTRTEDDKYVFIRKGMQLEYGVRRNPQKIIEAMSKAKNDLSLGVDPNIIAAELGRLHG